MIKNILMTLSLFIWSSNAVAAEDSDVLLKQEAAFSAYSAQHGFQAAFDKFMADDIVKLDRGSLPLIGSQAVRETMSADPSKISITWVPSDARISASKDLGYTWGIYKVVRTIEDSPPKTSYGKYFTIWQKNASGEWKVVLDGGNSLPKDYTPNS